MRVLILMFVLATTASAQSVPQIGVLSSADRSVVRGASLESASDWGFTDDSGNVFFYIYSSYEPEFSESAVVRVDGRLYTLRLVGEPREVERRGRYGTVRRFRSEDETVTVSAVVMWEESEGGDCGYGNGGIAVQRRGREATRNLSIQSCSAMYEAF